MRILLLALLLLASGSRLVSIAGHVPVTVEILRAAGRCPDPGPLFLRGGCAGQLSGHRKTQKDTDSVSFCVLLWPQRLEACSGDDLRVCYITALAGHARGDGDVAATALRPVAAAGYRRPYADALLAYHLYKRHATMEAEAVWRACGSRDCEELLIRAGSADACAAAAALEPGSPAASLCVATVARNAGEFDKALTWFRKALDSLDRQTQTAPAAQTAAPPRLSRAEVLYRMGETEFVRGRVEAAERLTSECLAAAPEHYWGWFQRALILAARGDSVEAIRELERVVGRYPEHGAALMHLGMLNRSLGNWDAAEQWLLRARAVLPDKTLADVELRRLALEKGSAQPR